MVTLIGVLGHVGNDIEHEEGEEKLAVLNRDSSQVYHERKSMG